MGQIINRFYTCNSCTFSLNQNFKLLVLLLFLAISKSLSSEWIIEDTLCRGDAFFHFISVVDSNIVWAAGSTWSTGEKVVYRRNISGIWDSIPLNGITGNQSITCLAGVNSQTAIIGMGSGNALLYRTTNAGNSWEVVVTVSGTNSFLNDVRFSRISPAYGYAWSDPPLGNGTPYKIYKTTNYGQNWIEFSYLYNSNYVGASPSICVTDSNHAWFGLSKNIGGTDYGKILYTSNGGINFSVLSIPLIGSFVTSVEFNVNNTLGYATIFEQSGNIAKTTSGGSNWAMLNPGFNVSCQRIISIPNCDIWYALNTATTMANRILKSTNSGLNWIQMQLPGGQYDVQFMDGIRVNNKSFVYCISTEGYILRLVDTISIIGIANNNSEIPNNFILKQNYPNPFNPVTTIEYCIPKREFVNISLYDVLGSEILKIESSLKNPGYYSVRVECKELAGGVYFYKINAGEFTDVKKMIVIK